MIHNVTSDGSGDHPEPNPFFPLESGRCIVNELPSELLSHIFTLGWASERDQHSDEDDFEDVDEGESDDGTISTASSLSNDGRSSTRSALDDEDRRARKQPFNVLVSHVCRQWRDIALDSSLLWTHIRFEGPSPWERALIYLHRAKTAPLSISIDRTLDDDDDDDGSQLDYDSEDEDDPKDNDPDLTIITDIMDIVVAHINHIQALEIMVSFYPHMHRALVKLGATPGAPLLEVLQLYHYEDTDEHESFRLQELREQPFVLFSGNAPRLTHVALWGVHLDWSKQGAPFLTGLVDFELAYHARDVRPSFMDFVRILRTSPSLQTLTLSLSGPAGAPGEWSSVNISASDDDDDDGGGTAMLVDSSAPLVLSRLQNLVLAYLEPAYLLALLPRLYLPSLTELVLDLEEADFSDLLAYLASPHSLPQPPLPPLSLRGPGVAGSPGPRARSLLANLSALRVASLPCAHEGVVLDAYKQLDKLVALNLNVFYTGEHWFGLLVPSPTPSTSANTNQNELYLPRLEVLTITGVEGARVRELVEVRAARGAPLREVRMNQDDDVEEEDETWLRGHLERFETFEGSDEEEVEIDGFEDEDDGWEDADDDEDDFDGGHIVVLPF